jgi:hypothetical protein
MLRLLHRLVCEITKYKTPYIFQFRITNQSSGLPYFVSATLYHALVAWIMITLLIFSLISSSRNTKHSSKLLINPIPDSNNSSKSTDIITNTKNLISHENLNTNRNTSSSTPRSVLKRRGFSSPYSTPKPDHDYITSFKIDRELSRTNFKTTDAEREQRYQRVLNREKMRRERA